MANIKVRSSNNSIIVRVGQTNATKVVASNAAASITASGTITEVNSDVTDTGRATNTFLMYNGTEYVHVNAADILDLADSSDDDTIDYGSF